MAGTKLRQMLSKSDLHCRLEVVSGCETRLVVYRSKLDSVRDPSTYIMAFPLTNEQLTEFVVHANCFIHQVES